MSGALDHIRVVDLSRVLAGPACTQILGDLGAEIIKIERPYAGDDTRQWGPPYMKDPEGNDTTESAYYLSANRSKKSLAVDIKTEEGQALIHQLLEKSDVLIHNFKVGGLEKYGLGYEQIEEKHPHLIYCAISGFGQNGPLAAEPGYDFVAQAMSGLMACTGEPDGQPMKAGVALSDIITGQYAAIGILSALQAREKTGKGQMIDLSLVDCTLAAQVNIAQYYLTSGELSPRLGNAHSTIVPYQVFDTKDGYIIIAIGNDRQFARFCDYVGRAEWKKNKKFQTNQARVKNRAELVPMIEEIIKDKTVQDWLDGFHAVDVPCGPVNTMDKVFAMEQTQARDMQIEMNHDLAGGSIPLVGSPLKMSETPVNYKDAPPYLGQHTAEILENLLQLSAEEITTLHEKKVVQT